MITGRDLFLGGANSLLRHVDSTLNNDVMDFKGNELKKNCSGVDSC